MALLYDQFGREMRPIKRPAVRDVTVASIHDRWSDYPSQGLTPQRLAAIFKEADLGVMRRQAEMFEEMEEKDPHLASQFQIRKLAVQGLDWEILPNGEDALAKKTAELCTETIEGLDDWDYHLLDFMDAVPKGYSMQHVRWDVSGNECRIIGLQHVHAKKVTFHSSLRPRVLTDDNSIEGIDPRPFEFAYHRYKARSGYDTRAGIMRVCAWMYLFKNYDVKDWVAFAEVYGQPLRVGKYEQGASQSDKDALLAAIRSLGSDAAGIISKATEIEFVEAQKYGSINVYEGLALFCDAQMSKAILGQVLTSEASGQDGSGSRALGEVHNEVRQDLVKADCRALAKTIRQQLLRPLVGFNYGWDAPVPFFQFHYEDDEDLQGLIEVYKGLNEIGFDLSQEHVSERFQVPVRQAGETPLQRTEGGGQKPDALQQAQPARYVAGDPAPKDVADVVALQLEQETDLDPVIDRVRELAAGVSSLVELRDRLLGEFGEMDASQFGELMQQALVLANLAGRADALDGA
jgi:phage gp29-like protein